MFVFVWRISVSVCQLTSAFTFACVDFFADNTLDRGTVWLGRGRGEKMISACAAVLAWLVRGLAARHVHVLVHSAGRVEPALPQ